MDYKNILRERYGFNDELLKVYENTKKFRGSDKDKYVKKLKSIEKSYGLCAVLLLLYRQQVESGFVLADPANTSNKEYIDVKDNKTNITFHVQWNPERELRKNHKLLIERKIINSVTNNTTLLNIDEHGKACYLCPENIEIQNPAEIIYPIRLVDENFFLGANFAYLTNNHFTLFNKTHRPQHYRKEVIAFLFDFLDKTDGCFRGVFNGLAGASIEQHEHMQVTTEKFPIEDITVSPENVIKHNYKIKISQPYYYTNLLLLESTDKKEIINHADIFLTSWHALNPEHYTENLVTVKQNTLYRLFIFPRDKNKLSGKGKTGAMASFETAGNIVLSDKETERDTFDNITLETIQNILAEIKPTDNLSLQFN